ncbi:TolC family protein [Scleromatobacter humisilvae]|uniref:Protein CyaE n=1 Tax=Scleromatobacter humisilvae TaxID=2897159 RepID=A0A9X1YMM3_9BURK|nr:TolC family protein [Scleromatobacter humisilvae]MCK9687157.1 TolC family protein [Scleromatobacter humisilvae]
MRRLESWGALMSALAMAACGTPAIDTMPASPGQPWRPATGPDGAIVGGRQQPANDPAGSSYVLPPNRTLASVVPPPSAIDPQHAYTLAELIDIAQSSHPETRIAWDDARRAALAEGIAESTYLPHVTASVIGGVRSTRGSQSGGDVGADASTSSSGTIAALSLEWLVFDFGQREAIVESAQQASIASNIAFTAAHQRVIHEVCLAFYANDAARARVAIAAASLKNAQQIEAAADERYRHGVGTAIDLAQARQATAQARLGDVQARGRAQDAMLALVTAMGISPLARFDVADVSGRPLSKASLQPIERIVSDAISRRPDVLGAYAAEKASEAAARAAEADFKPKVFMSATGAHASGRLDVTAVPPVGQQSGTFNLSGGHWGSTVLLGVTVPLYDAGLRKSTLGQARAAADAATAQSERVRDEAVRQIVMAQNALETSLEANEAAQALVDAARINFDAAFDAYGHGVGTTTAVTLAATQLLQAQEAAIDAHSAALSAAATLAFATGALGAAPP